MLRKTPIARSFFRGPLFLFFIFRTTFGQPVFFQSSPETAKVLSQKILCAEGIRAVGKSIFRQKMDDGPLNIGVERHLGSFVGAMAMSGQITEAQKNILLKKLGLLINTATSNRSPWLDHSLAAAFRAKDRATFNDIDLWLCYGMNCSSTDGDFLGEVNMPFNYILRDVESISADENLEAQVVQQDVISKAKPPNRLPHPNIGLSRIEAVFLDPPKSSDEKELENWVSSAMKEVSIYFVHQELSKWATRNNFLISLGKMADPLFSNNIQLKGRVYVIDPAFYALMMVGIKYEVKISALKVMRGALTAEEEKHLRDEAWRDEFQARVSNEILKAFEERNGVKLTRENLSSLAGTWLTAIRAANKETTIVHSAHVYPDQSFGIMPLGVQIGSPPD